jgi:hypothetical protein
MPTTAELLGLTPQEVNAAAFTASGEGAPGKDIGGVLQTILSRRALNPKSNIVSLVTAPQQFVANAPYSVGQVTDPGYGTKIYGSKYNQALQTLQNPNLMSGYLQAGQGATSFRGQALLKNKHKDDIMFSPEGNFYFDKNPAVANQLIQRLGQPSALSIPTATGPTAPPPVPGGPTAPPPVPDDAAKAQLKQFADTIKSALYPSGFGNYFGEPPSLAVTPFGGASTTGSSNQSTATTNPIIDAITKGSGGNYFGAGGPGQYF